MPEAEAAVAILHTREPRESVLLMRRAERQGDPWSGHWSFPGGHCEPEDADLLETALRELYEECGVRLSRGQLERALKLAPAGRHHGHFMQVAPFLFEVDTELPTRLDTREAVESRWVGLELVADPSEHRLQTVPGMPREMLFPSIMLHPMPLWGFTYRMITEWLELIPAARDRTGFELADRLLMLLRSLGVTVEQDWKDRHAVVRGGIPVEAVVEHLTAMNTHFPAVSVVEVRPEAIRVMGLKLEENLIRATGSPQ